MTDHTEHEVQLASEKSRHIWEVQDQIATLAATEQVYTEFIAQASVMMDRLIAGDPEGLVIGDRIKTIWSGG